jgi:adenine phosphoribosyltransferase
MRVQECTEECINLNELNNKEMKDEKLDLKSKIRRIPEFKGVVFWDITPLLKDRYAFRECIKQMAYHYRGKDIDVVVSSEARGFILGATLAYELGVGFVPIRKKGKLPSKTVNLTYQKEYEPDTIEIHEDSIELGQKILIIDDLLATGGTIKANAELVEKLGGKIVGIGFLIELEYLHGREALGNKYEIFSIIHYKTSNG